jgi:ABC-type nickel/cobalt efflux system permease component RcnA
VHLLVVLAILGMGKYVAAHPMGNFSINHYARFQATPARVDLYYVLDMAEIPTVTEKTAMDADGNGVVSVEKRRAYVRAKSAELAQHLRVTVNDASVAIVPQNAAIELRPGAAKLDTMRLTFAATIPLSATSSDAGWRISYEDDNYPQRTGWKEIVVNGTAGAGIAAANVASQDRSRELTVYPADPGVATPQQTSAQFTVQGRAGAAGVSVRSATPEAKSPTNSSTPQDAFTQSVTAVRLTPTVIALSLALALLFGGLHALSPGHGKAMVAAYLVGTRGTVRHAILLGFVVTLTHTVVVYAIGLITLVAARYMVPERLYPIISMLSGATVLCLGLGMLAMRGRALLVSRKSRGFESDLDTDDIEGWERFASEEAPELPAASQVSRATQSEDAISTGALIALGISGGALPCPSALVVLLSAIAMHRTGFGMLLIVAYSLGLALVLTGIGILVVKARGLVARIPSSGRIMAAMPVFSAAAITVIGCYLLTSAWAAR